MKRLEVLSSRSPRVEQKKTIFLTGATGIVGSQLLLELMSREDIGRIICLIRGKNRAEAQARLESLVGPLSDHCSVVTGDITSPLCGFNHNELRELARESIDVVVHCAACTKMDASLQREIFETNAIGTGNVISMIRMLEYFSDANGSIHLHYISTAYQADGHDKTYGLNNSYELSKYVAELQVQVSQIPFSISRIPIVIGRSSDGWIAGHSGYTAFMAVFNTMAQRIRRKEGLADNTEIYLPVTIRCTAESNLNLVMVDWVAKMLAHVTCIEPQKKIVYLVHPNPPNARWVLRKGLEFLGITGVNFGDEPKAHEPHHAEQQIIIRLVDSPFTPYLTKVAGFQSRASEVAEVIGNDYQEHEAITPQVIERVLGFSREMDFKNGICSPQKLKTMQA